MMIIYSIKLSKFKNESEFEAFMLTKIFSSVDKSLMRDSRITELILLKGKTVGQSHEYLWLMHGNSIGSIPSQAIGRIEAFGAQVSPMQEFSEVGNWFAAYSQKICA